MKIVEKEKNIVKLSINKRQKLHIYIILGVVVH